MNFLKKDVQEEAKIARKRLLEAERKKRIFDPRTRLFGVDVHGLEQQIHEKKILEERERTREAVFTDAQLSEQQAWQQRQQEHAAARARTNQQLNQYRQMQARLPRPSASGVSPVVDTDYSLRFDGEDAEKERREAAQRQQTRAWLEQQIAEKQERQVAEAHMREEQASVHRNRDAVAQQLAQLQQKAQRRLLTATRHFNQLQADEKAVRALEAGAEQRRVEAREIHNWVTGDWLCERTPLTPAPPPLGHRVIPYMYKGEPPATSTNTRHQQIQQQHQHKIAKQAELAQSEQWHQHHTTQLHQANQLAQQVLQKQRAEKVRQMAINGELAEEQRRREQDTNRTMPLIHSPHFLRQFNTTTY